MLADDILAARGGMADRSFAGMVSAFAEDVRRAARFDLTVVALVSAVMVSGNVAATVAELNLVSIPAPTPEDAQRWAQKIMGQTHE